MGVELSVAELVDVRRPKAGVALAASRDVRKVRIKTVIIRTEVTRTNQRDGKPKTETTTVRTRTKITRRERIRQYRGPRVKSRADSQDGEANTTQPEVEETTPTPEATPEIETTTSLQ